MPEIPGAQCAGAQTPAGQVAPLNIDASGFLKVNVAAGGGAGGTSSTFGAAMPGTGTAAGASDGVNMKPLLVDGSGNLKIAGSFTATPDRSSTVSAAGPTTVGTSPVTLLAANLNRKKFILQNVGTNNIWILFGAGTPSSSNYHIALTPGGTSNDGSSPPYIDVMWQDQVRAVASGAGGSVAVSEFT